MNFLGDFFRRQPREVIIQWGVYEVEVLSLRDALDFDRQRVKENYKEYVNSGLATLLGMLDFDKQYVKAEGVKVWDSEGNEYLDLLGGYGALNLGHNHPEVINAVKETMDAMCPNLLQASMGTLASALGESIAAVVPGDLKHSFFANSGAEAVEGALKTARIASGKQVIVSTEGSFHGKSFGCLSASGREKYRKPFEPLVPGFEHVPFGDSEALEKRLKRKDVAAFIVEPVQGEGGVVIPPAGYLRAVRELCNKYDVLLIDDEIQTGFGRTGTMFGCDHDGIAPDIMALSKSLGGGVMPLAAFVCTEKVWKKAYGSIDKCLLHTSTFGGNTFACAAGIAAIKATKDLDLPGQAREKGRYFLDRILALKEKYAIVQDVRGIGLLIGIEFKQPKGLLNTLTGGALSSVSQEFLGSMVAGVLQNEHRIITAYTLNNPNVIRLEPPLIITQDQIDQAVKALEETFAKYKSLTSFTITSAKTMISSKI